MADLIPQVPVKITDNTNTVTVTGANALKVDNSAVTQPVSGTVTANQGTAAAGSGAWPMTVTTTGDVVVKPGDSGNNAIRVNIVAGAAGGVSHVDEAAFTEGTTTFVPIGGVFNDAGGSDPSEDTASCARITVKRALHINLRNVAGTEVGTSGAPVRTDPTGSTTQPVSGTVTANAGSGTFTVSGTVTANAGTGTFTVAQTNIATADYDSAGGTVTQSMMGIALPASGGPVAGGTATNPVRVDPTGTTAQPITDNGASLTVDGTVTANQGTAAAGSGAWPIAVTTTGDVVVKPGDSGNNAIRVNVVAGASGGTSMTDETGFTEGSGSFTPIGGVLNDSIGSDPTEDQGAAVRITAKRAFHVNLRSVGGTEIGTSGAPVRVDPTGTTTQPVSGTVLINETSVGTVHHYATSSSVANGATGTLTYTTSGGVTFYLKQIIASASSGPCKVTVDFGAGPTNVAVVFFSAANPYVSITFEQPVEIAATTAVNIKIRNDAGASQDVYGTIIGREV